ISRMGFSATRWGAPRACPMARGFGRVWDASSCGGLRAGKPRDHPAPSAPGCRVLAVDRLTLRENRALTLRHTETVWQIERAVPAGTERPWAHARERTAARRARHPRQTRRRKLTI